MLQIYILFALLAMVFYGFSDFTGALAARRDHPIRAALWSLLVGSAILFIVYLLFFRSSMISADALFILIIAGMIGACATLAFFKGMQVGKVAIVSPISNAWSVVIVLFGIAFFLQKPSVIESIGIVMIIASTILISLDLKQIRKLRFEGIESGIAYGLVGMLGWGIMFLLMDFVIPKTGWFLPVFIIYIVQSAVALALTLWAKKGLWASSKSVPYILTNGVFGVVAFLAYSVGVSSGNAVIVAPIAASAPFITVILAILLLRERLRAGQLLSVAAIILGIVILAV